jgi:hypothetical protein
MPLLVEDGTDKLAESSSPSGTSAQTTRGWVRRDKVPYRRYPYAAPVMEELAPPIEVLGQPTTSNDQKERFQAFHPSSVEPHFPRTSQFDLIKPPTCVRYYHQLIRAHRSVVANVVYDV